MDKKTLPILALGIVFMIGYSVLLQKFYPQYGRAPKNAVSEKAKPGGTQVSSASGGHEPSEAEVLPKDANVVFQNQNLNLIFNKKSGSINEISLPGYNNSETRKPIQLFSAEESSKTFSYIDVVENDQILTPKNFNVQTGRNNIQADTSASGLTLSKNYNFSGKYNGVITVVFENVSDSPKELQYNFVVGPSFPPRHSIDSQYIEANFFQSVGDTKSLKHLKAPKPDKWTDSTGALTWLAVKDRHFSVIVKPLSDQFSGRIYGFKDHVFTADLISPKISVPARGRVEHKFDFYIGPNILDELSVAGFEDLVNFGKFDWIAKALVGVLELLNKVFRNYGLAIIALTFLINVFLFPLTRNSLMSMKRMQLVQPQMTKLREQNKNNPEKLHKEMMELYKKHKVNPFGGCLPMLVQMPVFLALYVALSKTVILINSKLFWIEDLSSPDKVHLPFTLPYLGNELHLLPLIMMAAMVIQQKFTQIKMEGQDPQIEAQQKMMAITMPFVFVFIFYSMPSGLVLYWLTNTIIMSLYQWHLKKVTLV